MKGWWYEGQFRAKFASAEWKTSKFRRSVQIIVILLSKVFRRKDSSTFPDKWILIIYQVVTSRSTLNWGELISSNVDVQLRKVQKDHQFYMSSYLMNVMCASLEFLLDGNGNPTFHRYMYTSRCYGTLNRRRIMS